MRVNVVRKGSVGGQRAKYVAERELAEIEKPVRRLFSQDEDELTRHQGFNLLSNNEGIPADDSCFEFVVSIRDQRVFDLLGETIDERKAAMREIVRGSLENLFNELQVKNVKWIAGIHLNTDNPHVHIIVNKNVTSVTDDSPTMLDNLPLNWCFIQGDYTSKAGSFFEKELDKRSLPAPPPTVKTVKGSLSVENEMPPNASKDEKGESLRQAATNYLINIREIDPATVEELHSNGSLYVNDKGHNVFVHRNVFGKTTGYTTLNRSTEDEGFFYIGDPKTAKRFIFTSSPIEAISLYDYNSARDLSEACFISIAGNRPQQSLLEFIARRSQKVNVRVIWSLQLTKDGKQDVEHLEATKDRLNELRQGLKTEKVLEVAFFTPNPRFGRTWNEQLTHKHFEGELESLRDARGQNQQIAKGVEIHKDSNNQSQNQVRSLEHDIYQRVSVRDKGEGVFAVIRNTDSKEIGTYNKEDNDYKISSINGEAVDTKLEINNVVEVIKWIEEESILREAFSGNQEVEIIPEEQSSQSPQTEGTNTLELNQLDTENPADELIITEQVPFPVDKANESEEGVEAKALPHTPTETDSETRRANMRELTNKLRSLPLETVLRELGFNRYQLKGEYVWEDGGKNHRIYVTRDLFTDRKDSFNGGRGSIDLVQHVLRIDFASARNWLYERFINEQQQNKEIPSPAPTASLKEVVEEKLLEMPMPNARNMDVVRTYLTVERGISPDIVEAEIQKGNLYANSFKSCVFVHRTPNGKVTGATWRATKGNARGNATGTNKFEGWYVIGDMNTAKVFVIVEAPIEAMSYLELHRNKTDLSETVIVSASGNAVQKNLLEFIAGKGEDVQIIFAQNPDEGGLVGYYSALERVGRLSLLRHKQRLIVGEIEIINFKGKIAYHSPSAEDWNDELKSLREIEKHAADKEHIALELAQEKEATAAGLIEAVDAVTQSRWRAKNYTSNSNPSKSDLRKQDVANASAALINAIDERYDNQWSSDAPKDLKELFDDLKVKLREVGMERVPKDYKLYTLAQKYVEPVPEQNKNQDDSPKEGYGRKDEIERVFVPIARTAGVTAEIELVRSGVDLKWRSSVKVETPFGKFSSELSNDEFGTATRPGGLGVAADKIRLHLLGIWQTDGIEVTAKNRIGRALYDVEHFERREGSKWDFAGAKSYIPKLTEEEKEVLRLWEERTLENNYYNENQIFSERGMKSGDINRRRIMFRLATTGRVELDFPNGINSGYTPKIKGGNPLLPEYRDVVETQTETQVESPKDKEQSINKGETVSSTIEEKKEPKNVTSKETTEQKIVVDYVNDTLLPRIIGIGEELNKHISENKAEIAKAINSSDERNRAYRHHNFLIERRNTEMQRLSRVLGRLSNDEALIVLENLKLDNKGGRDNHLVAIINYADYNSRGKFVESETSVFEASQAIDRNKAKESTNVRNEQNSRESQTGTSRLQEEMASDGNRLYDGIATERVGEIIGGRESSGIGSEAGQSGIGDGRGTVDESKQWGPVMDGDGIGAGAQSTLPTGAGGLGDRSAGRDDERRDGGVFNSESAVEFGQNEIEKPLVTDTRFQHEDFTIPSTTANGIIEPSSENVITENERALINDGERNGSGFQSTDNRGKDQSQTDSRDRDELNRAGEIRRPDGESVSKYLTPEQRDRNERIRIGELGLSSENRELLSFTDGSRAVDEEGHPLVLLHGTDAADVEKLSPEFTGRSQYYGVFYTDTPRLASLFASYRAGGEEDNASYVYASVISAKNPFKMKASYDVNELAKIDRDAAQGAWALAIEENKQLPQGEHFYTSLLAELAVRKYSTLYGLLETEEKKEIVKVACGMLQTAGFDSIQTTYYKGDFEKSHVWVTFKSEQSRFVSEFSNYEDRALAIEEAFQIETEEIQQPAQNRQAEEHEVALAWGQKKRHIAVDGSVLCSPQFSKDVRQRGADNYNSLTVHGIPQHEKRHDDTQVSHHDGKIPFKPLSEQTGIITSSICKQCHTKYESFFDENKNAEKIVESKVESKIDTKTHKTLLNGDAHIIINPSNTVGVMGAGSSKAIAAKYPEVAADFKEICQQKAGRIKFDLYMLHSAQTSDGKWVIHIPTKRDWREPSKLEYVEKGIDLLVNNISSPEGSIHQIVKQIKSSGETPRIAMPLLGTGHGGLEPLSINNLLIEKLSPLTEKQGIIVDVYDVNGLLFTIGESTPTNALNNSAAELKESLPEETSIEAENFINEVAKITDEVLSWKQGDWPEIDLEAFYNSRYYYYDHEGDPYESLDMAVAESQRLHDIIPEGKDYLKRNISPATGRNFTKKERGKFEKEIDEMIATYLARFNEVEATFGVNVANEFRRRVENCKPLNLENNDASQTTIIDESPEFTPSIFKPKDEIQSDGTFNNLTTENRTPSLFDLIEEEENIREVHKETGNASTNIPVITFATTLPIEQTLVENEEDTLNPAEEFIEEKQTPIRTEEEQPFGKSEKNVAVLITKLGLNEKIVEGESFYIKVENKPYIDLVIERHNDQLYLTHYGKKGGDLFIETEMVFTILDGYIKLSETAVFSMGREFRSNEREFAELFSTNLLDQGFARGRLLTKDGAELRKRIETNDEEVNEQSIKAFSDEIAEVLLSSDILNKQASANGFNTFINGDFFESLHSTVVVAASNDNPIALTLLEENLRDSKFGKEMAERIYNEFADKRAIEEFESEKTSSDQEEQKPEDITLKDDVEIKEITHERNLNRDELQRKIENGEIVDLDLLSDYPDLQEHALNKTLGIIAESEGESFDTTASVPAGNDFSDTEKSTTENKDNLKETIEEIIENLGIEAKVLSEEEFFDEVRRDRAEEELAVTFERNSNNYRITDVHIHDGSMKSKFQQNVDAIILLRQIEDEEREATREEKDIIARYCGWGGMKGAFNIYNDEAGAWEKERDLLRSLLKPDEWQEASRSVLNGHFTSPEVIGRVWTIAEHLGFTGGRILEPAMGVGNFFGCLPESLQNKVGLTGIELDGLTARMAQVLYPDARILNKGYENFHVPDGWFDLVIGNVPFGDYRVDDKPYNKYDANIHDYFFIKSLDQLRDGGFQILITSTGTMDKQDSAIRRRLARDAKLVGAIRLPEDTFKKNAGTSVVTDILVFQKKTAEERQREQNISETRQLAEARWQYTGDIIVDLQEKLHKLSGNAKKEALAEIKRLEGELNDHFPNVEIARAVEKTLEPSWLEVTTVPDPDGGEPIVINRYYAEHPEMLLGRLDRSGSMYHGNSVNLVRQEDFDEKFQAAINSLPVNIYIPPAHDDLEQTGIENILLTEENREGSIEIREGKLYRAEKMNNGGLILVEDKDIKPGDIRRAERLLDVRDALRNLINGELEESENTNQLRSELNRVYDQFIRAYGYINNPDNRRVLGDEPDQHLLLALERYDAKKKTATKADIFEKPTIRGYSRPTSAETLTEAIGITLNEFGRLNMLRVCDLLKQSPEQVEKDLIEQSLAYQDPRTMRWEMRDEYLSGNVKQKLLEAELACAGEPEKYSPNVAALKEVIPPDLDYTEIDVSLGAAWVETYDVQDFLAHLTGGERDDFAVAYSKLSGAWAVSYTRQGTDKHRYKAASKEIWGTERMNMIDIVQHVVDGRSIIIRDKIRTTKGDEYVVNHEATEAANAKARDIKEEFKEWIWQDNERRHRLHRKYNDVYNNVVTQKYDGSHLTFPGMAKEIDGIPFELRDSQKNAIWRTIREGKAIYGHEVGAGKAQPLTAKILTPSGWKLMGDIGIGDIVIAGDGSHTLVTGIYPQGFKQIYKVTFSDGSSTECCDEHLWFTQTWQERNNSYRGYDHPGKVRSLAEIKDSLIARKNTIKTKNHSIPMVGSVQFLPQPITVDPYLLGVLLGDGCMRTRGVNFTTADEEMVSNVAAAIPDSLEVRKFNSDKFTYSISRKPGTGKFNILTDELRLLGVHGLLSYDKFIPNSYKFNSPEIRLAVLQGLLDTDGTLRRTIGDNISLSTSSKRLAEDVVFIVQSLGGIAKVSEKKTKSIAKNYIVSISLPPHIAPFRLSRKANFVKPKTKYPPKRYIKNVEYIGEKVAQCITVSHPEHLYVTDDFIVTHNSYTIIAAAMEMKRLGLTNKPTIGCLKANIEQITEDAHKLYPNARIFSTIGQFAEAERKETASKIATTDCDLVIMTHEHIDRLEMRPEARVRHIQAELDELSDCIINASDKEDTRYRGNRIVATLEKARERLKADLKEILSKNKDNAVFFEETGIDFLFIDEFHRYKSLKVYTARGQVKGIPTNRSERATNMFARFRWLHERNDGRGTVGATGTPIANTTAELYNLQRYFQYEELHTRGIASFDAWASVFGETSERIERTATGQYKSVSRFCEFKNLPELLSLANQVLDVKLIEDIPGIVLPKRSDEVIKSTMTSEQLDYLATLQERASKLKWGSRDNMLAISTDARLMSLDLRLVVPGASDDPQSKVNLCVEDVLRTHQERPYATQLIFSDIGVHKNDWGFSVYDDIIKKLVAGGIPRDKIINFATLTEKQRRVAKSRLQSGDALIAIGSTEKLGTGNNVQRLLYKSHDLDVAWLPAYMTQRIGRIVRQGNIHVEKDEPVKIHRYVTVGGYDEFMWQTNDRKLKFINAIMRGGAHIKDVERSIKEVDAEELTFAQLAAIASGNPDTLKRIQLEDELGSLTRAKRRHQQSQLRFQDEVLSIDRQIAATEALKTRFQEDLEIVTTANKEIAARVDEAKAANAILRSKFEAWREERHNDFENKLIDHETYKKEVAEKREALEKEKAYEGEFNVTIKGIEYTNRANAAHELMSRMNSAFRQSIVGDYKGLAISVSADIVGERLWVNTNLVGKESYPVNFASPEGAFASMEGIVRKIPHLITHCDEQIESLRINKEKVQQEIGKPFKHEERLKEVRKELEEVEFRLLLHGKSEEDQNKIIAEKEARKAKAEAEAKMSEEEKALSKEARIEAINARLREIENRKAQIMPDTDEYQLLKHEIKHLCYERDEIREEIQAQAIKQREEENNLKAKQFNAADETENPRIAEIKHSDQPQESEQIENEDPLAKFPDTTIQLMIDVYKNQQSGNIEEAERLAILIGERETMTKEDVLAFVDFAFNESGKQDDEKLSADRDKENGYFSSLKADEAFAREADVLKGMPISFYIDEIEFMTDEKGRIYINPPAHELLRRAYTDARVGPSREDGAFAGVFNEPEIVDRLLESLDHIAEDHPEQKEKIESFTKAIADASLNYDGSAIFYTNKGAILHEEIHRASFFARQGKSLEEGHGLFEELVFSPEYRQAKPSLINEYKTDNDAILIEELAAASAVLLEKSGTESEVSEEKVFTLSKEQAAEYLSLWFESIARKNGDLSKEEFEELANESARIRDEAYERAKQPIESRTQSPSPDEIMGDERSLEKGRSQGNFRDDEKYGFSTNAGGQSNVIVERKPSLLDELLRVDEITPKSSNIITREISDDEKVLIEKHQQVVSIAVSTYKEIKGEEISIDLQAAIARQTEESSKLPVTEKQNENISYLVKARGENPPDFNNRVEANMWLVGQSNEWLHTWTISVVNAAQKNVELDQREKLRTDSEILGEALISEFETENARYKLNKAEEQAVFKRYRIQTEEGEKLLSIKDIETQAAIAVRQELSSKINNESNNEGEEKPNSEISVKGKPQNYEELFQVEMEKRSNLILAVKEKHNEELERLNDAVTKAEDKQRANIEIAEMVLGSYEKDNYPKPFIPFRKIEALQEEAINRNSVVDFSNLELLRNTSSNGNNKEPRSEKGAARLFAQSEIVNLQHRLAAHKLELFDETSHVRRFEVKGYDRNNFGPRSSKEETNKEENKWSLQDVTKAIQNAELEKARHEKNAEAHNEIAYSQPGIYIKRQLNLALNPFNAVSGELGMFRDPLGWANNQLNPIAKMMNHDPVVMGAISFGKFVNAKYAAYEAKKAAAECDKQITELKENVLTNVNEQIDSTRDALKANVDKAAKMNNTLTEAVKNEKSARISKNLDVPEPQFKEFELKQMSAGAVDLKDAALLRQFDSAAENAQKAQGLLRGEDLGARNAARALYAEAKAIEAEQKVKLLDKPIGKEGLTVKDYTPVKVTFDGNNQALSSQDALKQRADVREQVAEALEEHEKRLFNQATKAREFADEVKQLSNECAPQFTEQEKAEIARIRNSITDTDLKSKINEVTEKAFSKNAPTSNEFESRIDLSDKDEEMEVFESNAKGNAAVTDEPSINTNVKENIVEEIKITTNDLNVADAISNKVVENNLTIENGSSLAQTYEAENMSRFAELVNMTGSQLPQEEITHFTNSLADIQPQASVDLPIQPAAIESQQLQNIATNTEEFTHRPFDVIDNSQKEFSSDISGRDREIDLADRERFAYRDDISKASQQEEIRDGVSLSAEETMAQSAVETETLIAEATESEEAAAIIELLP